MSTTPATPRPSSRTSRSPATSPRPVRRTSSCDIGAYEHEGPFPPADNVDPQTQILTGPAVAAERAVFTFAATDNVSPPSEILYECRLEPVDVENAVQNTEPGDTVAVGTRLEPDGCRIWVRDEGSGVAAGDLPHIFERFRRGASAHLRYRGSGVGLSIVQAIAEAHGGRAEVSSEPGEGATFAVLIPATREGRS